MLHDKFRRNRPAGSGEEDFLVFLPYMGVAAILVMCSRSREQTFVSPTHGCSTQNLSFIFQAVSEKKMFENVNGRTDVRTDGRTDARTDAGSTTIL